ncbi:MAG: serine protease [Deltaproteobacteria bacterium]|nr:serine protease [Deltaproteobacteria bacterium]
MYFLCSSAFAELSISHIAKKYSLSVVTIVALDQNDQLLSLGSGLFINTLGHIAKNPHVLESSAEAVVKTVKGEKARGIQVIRDDPKLDLLIQKHL